MNTPLLLDISRLLGRAQRGSPTGIDRVEHAYAEQLLLQAPDRLHFVVIDKLDRLCNLPLEATTRFIATIGTHWRGEGASAAEIGTAARMLWMRALLRPALDPRVARSGKRPFYLLISHRHLHRPDRLRRAIGPSGARMIAFVHDLIPIEFPEYARPQHAELHTRRIRTVAAMAEAVIVNSQATAQALQPFVDEAGRAPPVLVAPLGVQPMLATPPRVQPMRATPARVQPMRAAPPRGQAVPTTPASVPQVAVLPPGEDSFAEPHFVYLGTIEPRKNHLMLLHVWRRLGEMLGDATPRLVLVGRRGWENENIVDMLERSVLIRAHVTEWTDVTDARINTLMRTSRAMLFPSFAEGFGLPVAEALAIGTPVISSDLPALRETGGDVPDYLDPLDGQGWLRAILDYTDPNSVARAAQMQRMSGWAPPNWPDHLRSVVDFMGRLPAQA